MNQLADALLKNDDLSIYLLILFCAIGFVAGFVFRLNAKSSKKKFEKMARDAESNKSRIAELREKITKLEKENLELGGTGGTNGGSL